MSDMKVVDIPKIFYSNETKNRFMYCVMCKKLLSGVTSYMIEKAFRDGKMFYEYALCTECAIKLDTTLSASSRMAVDDLYNQHVDFQLRQIELMAADSDRVEPWLSECIISRKPIGPESEHQIIGFCRGSLMVLQDFPFAISSAVVEALYEKLSAKTKGEIDRFTEDYLGLPPASLRGPTRLRVLV